MGEKDYLNINDLLKIIEYVEENKKISYYKIIKRPTENPYVAYCWLVRLKHKKYWKIIGKEKLDESLLRRRHTCV